MTVVQQFFSGGAWFAIVVVIYLAMIAFGLIAFAKLNHKQHKLTHPRQHRVLLAVFLALVFTPGILPNWLVVIPVPATFGLILLAPNLVFPNLTFSDQRLGIIMLYVYPLLFGFAIFYAALFIKEWSRNRTKHDQTA